VSRSPSNRRCPRWTTGRRCEQQTVFTIFRLQHSPPPLPGADPGCTQLCRRRLNSHSMWAIFEPSSQYMPHFDVSFALSESVREDQTGLQSFRSMRRIEARRKNASAVRLRFSQSLASLRQRLSQAIVRSTIQRWCRPSCGWNLAWRDLR
jgi:hypothetical protein